MGRKLDLNPGRMLKRSVKRASKAVTIPMGALERRLNPPKPATGVRGRAGGTQDQKHVRAERAMRNRAAEHEYARNNPSKLRMNPSSKLDTSQVEDRRGQTPPKKMGPPVRTRVSQSAMQRRLYGKNKRR